MDSQMEKSGTTHPFKKKRITHPTLSKSWVDKPLQRDTSMSHETRPAICDFATPRCTNNPQVLSEHIPQIVQASVLNRRRDTVCCLAVVRVLALTALLREVRGVFYHERLAIECKYPPIASIVYLPVCVASIGSHVLPIVVHDTYVIPPPFLPEYMDHSNRML